MSMSFNGPRKHLCIEGFILISQIMAIEINFKLFTSKMLFPSLICQENYSVINLIAPSASFRALSQLCLRSALSLH